MHHDEKRNDDEQPMESSKEYDRHFAVLPFGISPLDDTTNGLAKSKQSKAKQTVYHSFGETVCTIIKRKDDKRKDR